MKRQEALSFGIFTQQRILKKDALSQISYTIESPLPKIYLVDALLDKANNGF